MSQPLSFTGSPTSYLSHCFQRVVLNGCCSPCLPVKSGVHILKFVHPFTSMASLLKECITLISSVFCSLMTFLGQMMSVCCRARRLTFSPSCSQATIIHLYKSQVTPIIKYRCVVWDPHLKRDQILLEHFAVKFVTKNWDTFASSLTTNLNLPPLSNCRTYKLVCTISFCTDTYTVPQIFF